MHPTDSDPGSTVRSLLAKGRGYHRSGLLEKAAACYTSVLAAQPANADALYLLGLVAYRRGALKKAIGLVDRALRADPDHALAHGSLGQICQDRGDDETALAQFRKAAALRPDNPDFRNGLGLSLARLGQLEPALAAFREAIRLRPAMASAHNNLGNVQRLRGDLEGAAGSYRQCLEHRPDFAEAHNNLGVLYQQQQQPEAARQCFEAAIAARTGYAEAHSNLGAVLNDQGDTERALIQFHNAMDLSPAFAEACVNAGMVLHKLGRYDTARETLDLAARIAPRNPTARWARCIAELDAVYPSTGAMMQAREGYETRLRELVAAADHDPGTLGTPGTVVGVMQPFLLPYQAQDDLALQTLYGDYVHAVMQKRVQSHCWPTKTSSALPRGISGGGRTGERVAPGSFSVVPGEGGKSADDVPRNHACRTAFPVGDGNLRSLPGPRYTLGEKEPGATLPGSRRRFMSPLAEVRPVRVGVVSGYFHDHSNWKAPIHGWLRHMGEGIELYGYYTGFRNDRATRVARSLLHRFHQGKSGEQLAELIGKDAVDVLIFPEVGMHPVTARLAAQRLAPVQCASWGHPVTTGLPTMDYFLSSDLMEPDGAQSAYRETLVRLPGLSFTCEAPDYRTRHAASRAQFGLGDDEIVYLCVQNLSKYLPRFDGLLAAIAGNVKGSRLVFIEGPGDITEIFRTRLRAAFDEAGVLFDRHVSFLPRLDRDRYHALNRVADIFLDTPEWSGCNSTLEALACDVPVVTLPGTWMRGRHSYAFYRRMDFDALTARDESHYIELAVRLGTDPRWRATQRQRIAQARTRLYGDPEPVRALSDFLRDAAGRAA